MELNLTSTDKITKVNEYGESPVTSIYNPNGVEIHYGFDGKKAYGALDENNDEFFFGGIEKSGGLHSVQLSRPLVEGEKITLNWKNGYRLIIWCDSDGITKVKRVKGGSYQEIKKEDGEKNVLLFNDDVYTKRFDYVESKIFEEF